MICRYEANELYLINQQDHAVLSGRLAQCWGNKDFATPRPPQQVVAAVIHHDDGWAPWDQRPRIGPDGTPVDFMATSPLLLVRIWAESIRLAAELGPMSGLLVSRHFTVLGEWGMAEAWDQEAREMPPVRAFFHQQASNQDQWRAMLDEESRACEPYNLALLRACDWISLTLCCTQVPPARVPVPASPSDQRPSQLHIAVAGEAYEVSPWPFSEDELAVTVEATAIPNRPFADETDLHAAMREAPRRLLKFPPMRPAFLGR